MHQKYLLFSVVLTLIAGIASNASSAEVINPANSARVRVYQQANITLYPGEFCYGSDNPQAIHAAKMGFSIFGTHKREGIPVTADIPGAYNEYVIQAGKPLTVMLQWEGEQKGVKVSCGPIGSTLYPQPGKDYDVTMGYSGNCFVQIRELYATSPGKAVARLAPAGSSFACYLK